MKIFLLTEEEYAAIQSGLSLHSEQIQQLQSELTALRLQALPHTTPEESEELPPLLGEIATDISEASRLAAAQKQVEEADAEHKRLNTKELPQ